MDPPVTSAARQISSNGISGDVDRQSDLSANNQIGSICQPNWPIRSQILTFRDCIAVRCWLGLPGATWVYMGLPLTTANPDFQG